MSVLDLATAHGWRRDKKLSFVSQSKSIATLEDAEGALIEVAPEVYRALIAEGFAWKPGGGSNLGFIPDEYGREKQGMKLHAIRRDGELRRNGHTASAAFRILETELREHPRFARYVPARFNLRTLQNWKKIKAEAGQSALLPGNQSQGNRTTRYDELYDDVAEGVLEELYLKSDRVALAVAASRAERIYRDKCATLGRTPGDCGKKSFQAVLSTLRADDVIKARHDNETAAKLRIQAQFYARVQLPFDLVEIDCTIGDLFLVDDHGACIGRPTICAAVDAATGFPLAIRLSIEPPKEDLTVRTLKDIMTPRGADFFERHGIENQVETCGTPQIISSDQGSENSGPWLASIIAQVGMEWGKNIPGCPQKKGHVERFFRELNGFLRTLNGATSSKSMPNKTRIEKGMLEACLTIRALEGIVYRWLYDTYARKLRRMIHSPLRQVESPTDSWHRLSGEAVLPLAPEEIHELFMIRKEVRKIQHYGIEVEKVHFHSSELRTLIETIGRKARVEVRYDPVDIREIAVIHDVAGLPSPLIVPAKSEDVAPIAFADVSRLKKASNSALDQDLSARAAAAALALEAQKAAEQCGRGKVSDMRSARAKERIRQKHADIVERAKIDAGKPFSAVEQANQPTPRLPVRRREQRADMDQME